MENKNEVKRTQGEWKFESDLNHSVYVADNNGKVYITGYTNGEANAAFICEAGNNYERIKEENESLNEEISNAVSEGKRLSEVATHWKKEYDKLKEDNALLLELNKDLLDIAKQVKFIFSNESNYPEGTIGFNLYKKCIEAIQKAESK